MSETVVYLLRHAQVIPEEGVNNKDWDLSEEGKRQAELLVSSLKALNIDIIYSSPYTRALETVKPLAKVLDVKIFTDEDLGENNPDLPYMAPVDFQEHMQKSWDDLDYALEGQESLKACQLRMLKAINKAAQMHEGKRILVCSHGTPICAVLKAFDARFGIDEWARVRMPDLFKLVSDGTHGHWDRSFTF